MYIPPALLLGMWLPGVNFQRRLSSCILGYEVLIKCCKHQVGVIAFAWLSAAARKPVSRMQQIHEIKVLDSKRRFVGKSEAQAFVSEG